MIHKYCCTNCGVQYPGEKIAFDLVELLDLDLSVKIDLLAKEGNYPGQNQAKTSPISIKEESVTDKSENDVRFRVI